ncbi:MAG: peptidoglycan-binding protein, partial [Caulobacterales bacterium]|nr:peptidoglycan-binding protein [Caulobacterales bacterium]
GRSDADESDVGMMTRVETVEPGFGPTPSSERKSRGGRRALTAVSGVVFIGLAATAITLVFDAGQRRAQLQEQAARDPIMDRMNEGGTTGGLLVVPSEPPIAADPGDTTDLARARAADIMGWDETPGAPLEPPADWDGGAAPFDMADIADIGEAPFASSSLPEEPSAADLPEGEPVSAPPLGDPIVLDTAPPPVPVDESVPAIESEPAPEPVVVADAAPVIEEAAAAPAAPSVPPPTAPTLEEAADAGDPVAQFQLGDAALHAGAVDAGARMMRQAAENGLAVAQYQLAKLFEHGRGVPRDFAQARVWTERAAAGGNRKAMHNLGIFFAEGRGAPQDFGEAARWFEEAALLGSTDSQYNLAVLYEQGLGVPLSLPDAYAWYQIAGRAGDDEAARRAEALAPRLTPEAKTRADEAVTRFTPRRMDDEANGVFWNRPWDGGAAASVSDADAGEIAIKTARAQMLLAELGYEPGPPDGAMGPRTRSAIRAYQQSRGLTETGRVDETLIVQLEADAAR